MAAMATPWGPILPKFGAKWTNGQQLGVPTMIETYWNYDWILNHMEFWCSFLEPQPWFGHVNSFRRRADLWSNGCHVPNDSRLCTDQSGNLAQRKGCVSSPMKFRHWFFWLCQFSAPSD
jgi:hypothetical protein